jgi:hypothetical protein
MSWPGTIGLVRGSIPKAAAAPTPQRHNTKAASFSWSVAGDLGKVFHNINRTVCEMTAAQTAP